LQVSGLILTKGVETKLGNTTPYAKRMLILARQVSIGSIADM
jgi:hypothetical protein